MRRRLAVVEGLAPRPLYSLVRRGRRHADVGAEAHERVRVRGRLARRVRRVGDAAIPYYHVPRLEAAADHGSFGVGVVVARQFKVIIASICAERLPVLVGEAREDGAVRAVD